MASPFQVILFGATVPLKALSNDRNLRSKGYTSSIRTSILQLILKGHNFDATDFGIFTRITSVLVGG